MEKLIVLILCLPLLSYGQSVDKTIIADSRGEDVVDAVIEKIRLECLLVEDKLLMKRTAAMQTDYGNSMSPNQGGIWKVTNNILSSVQSMCQTNLRHICDRLTQVFTFDVSIATMQHMNTPIYSGIIMHTYITGLTKVIPVSVSGQASFWKQHIDVTGDMSSFVTKSNITASCSAVKMELVFAIDASGSVGRANFQKTLNFLKDVVDSFDVSAQYTRVSVIRFASYSTTTIALGAYNTVAALKTAINSTMYTGGGTATHKAINMARTQIFTKARSNVPKVFVLVTDGVSRSITLTVAAANKLKLDNVEIFTIGIGSVRHSEMHQVASSPNCTHFFYLQSYTDISAIVYEIQRKSCTAAAVITPNGPSNITDIDNNPIPPGNTSTTQNVFIPNNNTASDSGNSTTVQVTVICGNVYVYGSNNFMRPSVAIYTYVAMATDGRPGIIRSPSELNLYVSVVAKRRTDVSNTICQNAHYNISVNPVDTGVTIICKENGIDRPCTYQDISQKFGPTCGSNQIPNPCTPTNIPLNTKRFKHPHFLNKYIQCKVTGQMEIVTCPTGTLYSVQQRVCNPQIISPPQGSTLYTGPNPCTAQALFNRQFYFANPSNATSFIQCNEGGTAYLVYCPNNTVWSQQAYTCAHASASPITNVCASGQTYHANPANIKSFIRCDSNGNAFVMPCGIGTVWSQNSKTCVLDNLNRPAAVTCTAADQYFPHPTNKNKYYQCDAGKEPVEMNCPSGLVWAGNWCDWPTSG